MKINICFCLIFLIACSTDFSPITEEFGNYIISIKPTGKSDYQSVEFAFTNTLDDSVWYLGYGIRSPLYLIQVINDTGWVYHGGWCGTGASLYLFAPLESFRLDVIKPANKYTWRIGLYTQRKGIEEGEYSWSCALN